VCVNASQRESVYSTQKLALTDASHRGWGKLFAGKSESGRTGLAMSLKEWDEGCCMLCKCKCKCPRAAAAIAAESASRQSKRLGAAWLWCWKDPCSHACGWGAEALSAGGRLRHPTLTPCARQTPKDTVTSHPTSSSCEFFLYTRLVKTPSAGVSSVKRKFMEVERVRRGPLKHRHELETRVNHDPTFQERELFFHPFQV
jgi:hypothetical protein